MKGRGLSNVFGYATLANLVAAAFVLSIATPAIFWFANGSYPPAIVALVFLLLGSAFALEVFGIRTNALDGMVVRAVLSAHVLLGMAAGFYEADWPYDKVIHVIIPFLIALRVSVFVREEIARGRAFMPKVMAAVFVFSVTMTIAALWELFEFGIDSTGLFAAQKGLVDTMCDLAADAIGAGTGALTVTYSSHFARIKTLLLRSA